MKKVLSFLVAMTMLVGVFSLYSFAETGDLVLSVSKAEGIAESEVDIVINISDNPGISLVVLTLKYDQTALELIGVTNGDVISDEDLDVGVNLMWSVDNETKATGTLVTLKFRILTSTVGEYAVAIEGRECYNDKENVVDFDITNGSVTVTDPPAVPEDVTVSTIGNIAYTVNGQTVTVEHNKACKIGYWDEAQSKYVAVSASPNGDGSYSFTVPENVDDVILVVKGDVSGEGTVNAADKMAVARSMLLSTHPAYQELTAIQAFAADTDNVNGVNAADKMTIARSMLLTTHPAYQALKW
ncbi:MAG: hypothetical protein IIV03_06275 [Clostridia bacterium]|nr:hypothetical protein [Clostridia bacterium]